MGKEINLLASLFDLTEYESGIYLALNGNGPMHLQNISKHSTIHRTAIYRPLKKLIEKGLISETIFGKRTYYSATPLQVLRHKLDQKRSTLENMIRDLSASKAIYSKQSGLEATIHLGAEGIKAAGLIFLNEAEQKTWYSFENLALTAERVGFEFEDFYVKERVKRGIRSKMILSITEETQAVRNMIKEDAEQLRETVLLSPHQYPFQTTVAAAKGIAILVNPGVNPFALIIRNDAISDTFIQLHKCIWDRYKN